MKVHLNEKRGDLLFCINHRGLNLVFDDGYSKPMHINVQEYEISSTRDTVPWNQVIIKNHAEFQGVVDDLILSKVIFGKPVRFIELGYIKYGVYRLTHEAIKEMQGQNKSMVAIS